MSIQKESELEKLLIKTLQENGNYDYTPEIKSEKALLSNLKKQIEIHNRKELKGTELSKDEFHRVQAHLTHKSSVFDRSKILRDKYCLKRDNGDTIYLQFLDTVNYCKNEFQVINQFAVDKDIRNRYDVTILINGLPLVHIELKKTGSDESLKAAFNQIVRYKKHTFKEGVGLYQFVQAFVISNGVNTKYFANNKEVNWLQTFTWSDETNKHINNLIEFTKSFLDPCHISMMIGHNMPLIETDETLIIMRPYQCHAVDKAMEIIKSGQKSGFIWHTTGSGKTLTAFQLSKELKELDFIEKVVLVVDRNDLSVQTEREFNHYSKGSIDSTEDTKGLMKKLLSNSPEDKLILTTIQKLTRAVTNENKEKLSSIKDKRIVFIFDECHRSQLGASHMNIVGFFANSQRIGFTGTPIFPENSNGFKTTADIFTRPLHTYLITDAIHDHNVLPFLIEYYSTIEGKDASEVSDELVRGINKSEVFTSLSRLDKIVDYINDTYSKKTNGGKYNSIFAVSSVDQLLRYYDIFKFKYSNNKTNRKLKIATIFSFSENEDAINYGGTQEFQEIDFEIDKFDGTKKEKLQQIVNDYNETYGTSFNINNADGYKAYHRDISERMKKHDDKNTEKNIDILLVVNMFLTGFDSKFINTVYVDKHLNYHGLVQTFSRANRLHEEGKIANIILFDRTTKEEVDTAFMLFANKENTSSVLLKEKSVYIKEFIESYRLLKAIADTPSEVDELMGETTQLEFVNKYSQAAHYMNILKAFSDFSYENDIAPLTNENIEQELAEYKSKYKDLYEKIKRQPIAEGEKESILSEINFNVHLLSRVYVNVDYILTILRGNIKETNTEKRNQGFKVALQIIEDSELRSKRDLFEKFINEVVPNISSDVTDDDFREKYEDFMTDNKDAELAQVCSSIGLDLDRTKKLIEENFVIFEGKIDLRRGDVRKLFIVQPEFTPDRTKIIQNAQNAILDYVERYYNEE